MLHRLYRESDYVHGGVFSSDGKRIGIATGNGNVRIYDADSLRVVNSAKLGASCRSIAWSPRNDFLVVGFEDGTIRVWSLPDFNLQPAVKGHQGPVLRLRFSRDGQRFYSNADWGGEGRVSYQWSFSDGQLTRLKSFPRYSVFDESFDPNTLVAGNQGTISILTDGKPIHDLYLFSGSISNAKYSPSSESIFVGSRTERSIRELDSRSLEVLNIFPHHKSVQAVAIEPVSNLWAAGDATGEFTIWRSVRRDEGVVKIASNGKSVQWLDLEKRFVVVGGNEALVYDKPMKKLIPSTSLAGL